MVKRAQKPLGSLGIIKVGRKTFRIGTEASEYLVSIDPGKNELASAHFWNGVLFKVLLTPREYFLRELEAPTTVVIEKPQIYPGCPSTDLNDLIEVTGAAFFAEAGIMCSGGPAAKYIHPKEWKRQAKKPPNHWKSWQALSIDEREVIARDTGLPSAQIGEKILSACKRLAGTGKVSKYSWAEHNIFDAVGIGLWFLKRTGKGT